MEEFLYLRTIRWLYTKWFLTVAWKSSTNKETKLLVIELFRIKFIVGVTIRKILKVQMEEYEGDEEK